MAAESRSRSWLFTLNNPSGDSDNPQIFLEGCSYAIYQLERGDSGTNHYQGYVEFKNVKRFSALKKINPRCHWEPRQGSHQQAVDYCSKEDTRVEGPWTIGEAPVGRGKRTDLLAIKAKIDGGATIKQLWQEDFGACLHYEKAFRSYQLSVIKPRDHKTVVTVLWGPTGVGKSRRLKQAYPEAFWKNKSKWWDGYCQEEHVVLDDFYGWIKFDEMLRLLDRYPLLVETKGGTTHFTSRFIHITSNKHPSSWYKRGHYYDALFRRFDYIVNVHTAEEDIVEKEPQDLPYSTFKSTPLSIPPPLSDDQ